MGPYKHSIWLVLAAVVYLFLMHLGSLNGHLLSDSISLIYNCYSWQQNDEMLQQLLSLFQRSSNEAGGSFMYRPLAMASFCSDYLLWGEQAFAHKLTQLLWHVANGLLLYVLVARVCAHYQLDKRFAAVTASLFLLSHLTPEVSVWVAGRFDIMVQTWMFLCLYAFWAQKRVLALVFLLLALLSKESAMVIVPMLISLSWFRHVGQPRVIQKTTQDTWVFIALLIAYLFFRWFLFGQTTQVYPQAGGIIDRMVSHAATFPTFLWRTLFAAVDHVILSGVYLLLMLGLFIYSFLVARRQQLLRLWLFIASGMAIVLLALITQVSAGELAGTGTRLFYIVIPWQVALVGLPLLFKNSLIYRVLLVGFLLVGTLMHCMVIQQWTSASQLSKKIINEVPAMAEHIDDNNWSLLLIPEQIGAALLARNAQGGMVSPPFQDKPYLDSVVPFVWGDLGLWRERANSQFVTQFKSNSSTPESQPLYATCIPKQGAFIQQEIATEVFASAANWQLFWQQMITDNDCYY